MRRQKTIVRSQEFPKELLFLLGKIRHVDADPAAAHVSTQRNQQNFQEIIRQERGSSTAENRPNAQQNSVCDSLGRGAKRLRGSARPCYCAASPPANPVRRSTRIGEVAEWSNAPHSKCGMRATVSGVRIPPSPPFPFVIIGFFGDFALQPPTYPPNTKPLEPSGNFRSTPRARRHRSDFGMSHAARFDGSAPSRPA